eukprot:GFUD01007439.1.p1 GENE.GFUD01007439.1~~GFUD01007439.1.p1  ORF type:complete len:1699 (-),score=403.24 GFUD01007439.1:397-5493(-)
MGTLAGMECSITAPLTKIMSKTRIRRKLILILLLMEGVTSALPPSIPYLVMRDGGHEQKIRTNQNTFYSPTSFDNFEMQCQSQTSDNSDTHYAWRMADEQQPLSNDQNSDHFNISGGTLAFLTPNYGTFECQAESETGTSYAFVTLTKHIADDSANLLTLVQGPEVNNIAENSDVNFSCEVLSDMPVIFTWTFNTNQVKTVRPSWVIEEVSTTKQTLLAAEVTKDDIGTVGCQVEVEDAKLYQEGTINIVQEPLSVVDSEVSAPIIISDWDPELQLLHGDNLDISCQATGSPPPAVHWKSDTASEELDESDDTRLLIRNIDNSKEGQFVCVATNNLGSVEKTVQVFVFSKLRMKYADRALAVQSRLGGPLELDCAYELDEKWAGEVSVKWKKNGQDLSSFSGENMLSISEVATKDAGTYKCLVETSLDRTEQEWNIEVVNSALITQFESSKISLVGSTAEFPCVATGIPKPKIQWYLNDEKVVDDDLMTTAEDGTLRIKSVTHDMSGYYRCEATNPSGTDQKTSQLVTVDPMTEKESREAVLYRNAGEPVVLDCSVNVDPLLEQTLTRKWIKDGTELSQGMIEGWEDEQIYIKYLLAEKAGHYTCIVNTSLDSITIPTELHVNTQPPRIVRFPDTLGQIAGGDVSIECIAEGIPPPTISFKFGNDDFTGTNIDSRHNSTTMQLNFDSVTPQHSGDYTCLAVNEYGNQKSTTRLDIFKRTVITTGLSSQTVDSGSMVTFTCEVTVDPRIKQSMRAVWMKDEAPFPNGGRINWSNEDLTIVDTEKEDEGIYSCTVHTEYDQVTSSGRLTVLNEPPTFTSTPNNIRVLEGRNTHLICQASGIPQPVVEWKFKSKTLESEKGRLELESVGRNQEGSYVCTAENTYGSIEKGVQVQVIRGVQRENENLVPDLVKNIKETISLPCDFKVDHRVEKETKFIWLKNEDNVLYDNIKYQLLQNKSLVIMDVELADQAQYTCKVITPLQEVQTHIQLIVSGESPEIINTFNKITIHEGEELLINCVARGSPRPALAWLLKDKPVLSSYLADVTMAESDFIEKRVKIKSATKIHEGIYQCVATNNVGSVVKNSHVVVIKRTKVSIASDEGPPEIRIQAGQKLKLPCRVENDERNRITNVNWKKDNKSIQVGVDDRIDFGYDGSLIIFNVQKRHEGTYKCTVTTLRDEASSEVPLRVIVNAPVITKSSPNQRMFSGTSLNLECISNGIPLPETKWTFNKTITNIVGEVYEVKSAISTDSGFYTCTAKNSIGETKKTIQVSVVTVHKLKEEYKMKKDSELILPCTRNSPDVKSEWQKGGSPISQTGEILVDNEGSLVFTSLAEHLEGDYSCSVQIIGGEQRVQKTKVRIIPDIVMTKSTQMEIKEGHNFTLKCDVLPGVNAKRMWKKDGELVFPESESGVDIVEQGGTLSVRSAKVSDNGVWSCVASTSWGRDTIEYTVKVKQIRQSRLACSELEPPVIQRIKSLSNTSVLLDWEVYHFNASCYEEFKIFWWTNQTNSFYYEQTVELKHRKATIGRLKPEMAYYFQVNLVRDSRLNIYHYGHTKTHWMVHIIPEELLSSSNSKAVIIIVIIIIIILLALLLLLYYKRKNVTDYLTERKKQKNGLEFAEFPTKLVANPDFMASLAPQWPEPDPDPTEDQAFIQRQRRLSRRRGSKESITSSWSSLFNVQSTEDITSEENYRDSLYRGRYRKE